MYHGWKENNSNITKSRHLIGWNGGEYHYSNLCDVVNALTIPDVKYYAKGLEKCRILSNLFKIPFENLENLDCPPLHELIADSDPIECVAFPKRHRLTPHCAQKTAVLYYKWLMDFEDLFAIL